MGFLHTSTGYAIVVALSSHHDSFVCFWHLVRTPECCSCRSCCCCCCCCRRLSPVVDWQLATGDWQLATGSGNWRLLPRPVACHLEDAGPARWALLNIKRRIATGRAAFNAKFRTTKGGSSRQVAGAKGTWYVPQSPNGHGCPFPLPPLPHWADSANASNCCR